MAKIKSKPRGGITGKTRNQIALMNARTKNAIRLKKADRYSQRLQNRAAATAGAGKTARFAAGTAAVTDMVDESTTQERISNDATAKRDAAKQANELVGAFETVGQTGSTPTTQYGGGGKYVNE